MRGNGLTSIAWTLFSSPDGEEFAFNVDVSFSIRSAFHHSEPILAFEFLSRA